MVSWNSKKQQTVARSSTEAEYRAIANATAKVLWLKSLLKEMGIPVTLRTKLWCDNVGATYLTANPVFHAQTKYVEIDFNFVREQVRNGFLQVQFLSTKDQIADILTKPLVSTRFQTLRAKLNVLSLPFHLRGNDKDNAGKCPNAVKSPDKDVI